MFNRNKPDARNLDARNLIVTSCLLALVSCSESSQNDETGLPVASLVQAIQPDLMQPEFNVQPAAASMKPAYVRISPSFAATLPVDQSSLAAQEQSVESVEATVWAETANMPEVGRQSGDKSKGKAEQVRNNKPKRKTKSEPEIQSDPAVNPEPEEMPEPAVLLQPLQPEVSPEPEVTAEPEVSPEPETTPDPEVNADPEGTPESEVEADPQVEADPEVAPEPEVKTDPEVTPEREVETEPETPTLAEPLPTSEILPYDEPKPGADPLLPPTFPSGEFCEGYVTDASSVKLPKIPKPAFMKQYNDPVFGAPVTRITNSAFGEVNKPTYSTMQAWNADESYLMLYRTGPNGGAHMLHDGHTYEFIRQVDIWPSDLEQVFWSYNDPDVFYYISNNRRGNDIGKFKRFNVSSNEAVVLDDFSSLCGSGLPGSGNDVQMHSMDDDLFGLTCQKDDGHHIMFSYQLSTGKIIEADIGMGTSWKVGTAPVAGASGDRFWFQGAVMDTDLTTINRRLDYAAPEHSSLGRTASGDDAYYQVSFGSSPGGCDGDLYNGVGHLVEHNLETGACRNIISEEQGYPYTTSSTHVSALSADKPERVAMSSIGNKGQLPLFTSGTNVPPLFSEIYVAQTTPDDTVVCRLAHHRSYGKSATRGGYASYFGEPHATISPSGTRILFGSDWYDSGSVDSYVIELPDYRRP